MLADAARRQLHQLTEDLGDVVFRDLPGALGVDVDAERFGNADCIGKLQDAALRKAGGDDVLGQVARCVGS